jgi:hypothetical protein
MARTRGSVERSPAEHLVSVDCFVMIGTAGRDRYPAGYAGNRASKIRASLKIVSPPDKTYTSYAKRERGVAVGESVERERERCGLSGFSLDLESLSLHAS